LIHDTHDGRGHAGILIGYHASELHLAEKRPLLLRFFRGSEMAKRFRGIAVGL
jgi:hypothetical protein